jgi:endonuclease YncB( thermonuclease family)
VTKIHDGDTITVDIDLGLSLTRRDLKIRFFGINAPEVATPAGKAALAFLKTLIAVGDEVVLDSHSWDKYGNRLDGDVWANPGAETTLNNQMVAAGHAVFYP